MTTAYATIEDAKIANEPAHEHNWQLWSSTATQKITPDNEHIVQNVYTWRCEHFTKCNAGWIRTYSNTNYDSINPNTK